MSLDFPDSIGASPADGDAIFALDLLFKRVSARFVKDKTQVELKFGWREPYRTLARPNRMIFVPGDDSGAIGKFGGPLYPGKKPQRALAGLWENFTVYILAADMSAPRSNDDELKQYRIARTMLDALVRAIILAFGASNMRIESARYLNESNERRFGVGIVLSGAILAVIPDLPVTLAPVDTDALIAETILDLTETELVKAEVE
jgi:hypothetical protein